MLALSVPAQAGDAWEFAPYHVAIVVATPAGPEWTARRDATLVSALTDRPLAALGGAWKLTVAKAPDEIEQHVRPGLDRLDTATEPIITRGETIKTSAANPYDTVIYVVVKTLAPGFSVEARQWDAATRHWGPAVRRVARAEALPAEAARAAAAAFTSQARIDEIDGDRAQMAIRAAALADGGTHSLLRPGDVLKPFWRDPSARNTSGAGTALEWTWLVVETVDGLKATGRIYSRFREPLRDAPSSSVEWLALRMTPPSASSRLRLLSLDDDRQPLAGFDVWSAAPGASSAERLGQTDANGSLRIDPAPAGLRLLAVTCGSQPLVRLPLVPGLEPQVEASLLFDEKWLRAQEAVDGLRQRLIDLVARRQVLASRLRSRIVAKAWNEAEELLAELGGLASRSQFEQSLTAAEQRVFSRDLAIRQDIRSMFEELSTSARKHLDPGLIDTLTAELRAAQAGAPPPADAAAEAGLPNP